ncbi:unnamed protein product, partial [Amoebophrya sp. A25]
TQRLPLLEGDGERDGRHGVVGDLNTTQFVPPALAARSTRSALVGIISNRNREGDAVDESLANSQRRSD